MKVVTKLGRELASGDIVRTWFDDQTILTMLPYTGPFEFVCGVAQFPSAEMSIERDGVYEVLLPS